MSFGAPTSPAGGSGSGGPAVDATARAAAIAAQAAADAAQDTADAAAASAASPVDSTARAAATTAQSTANSAAAAAATAQDDAYAAVSGSAHDSTARSAAATAQTTANAAATAAASPVDSTARAAASAAQADATAALEGDAVDLVARDAAADNAVAIGALPGPILRCLLRFRRTTSTAYTDGVDESAIQNCELVTLGEGLALTGGNIVVGPGVSFIRVTAMEIGPSSATTMRSMRLSLNGSVVGTRRQSLVINEEMLIVNTVAVSEGDAVSVLYYSGTFTSNSASYLNHIVVEAFG